MQLSNSIDKTSVMKKTTLFLSTFILTVLSFADISAQTSFEVPPDVQLNVREDYAKYEPDIIAASKWLETNDLDKEAAKRKEVSAFVMKLTRQRYMPTPARALPMASSLVLVPRSVFPRKKCMRVGRWACVKW